MRRLAALFRFIPVSALLLCILCAGPASAGRPLGTEDAGTVGKGNVQVETAREWSEAASGDWTVDQNYVLTFGLADNLDLIVERPYSFQVPLQGSPLAGNGNTALAVKYRFMEETRHRPAVGFKAYSELSDGERSLGAGSPRYGINWFATRSTGGVTLHGNIGYNLADASRGFSPADTFTGSIAVVKPLGSRFALAGELLGESSAEGAGAVAAQIGATWQISPSVTLDAGFARGLNDSSPRRSFTVGATVVF